MLVSSPFGTRAHAPGRAAGPWDEVQRKERRSVHSLTASGERWLESVAPSLKVKTQASYESLFRTLIVPRFGNQEVREICPIDVSKWVASMTKRKLSASRVRQAHTGRSDHE
jgi:hypothetical protein